jgi:hypothetical protein
MTVVGTTPQREVRHGRRTATGEWDKVMKLEVAGLAAPALRALKRTAALIAAPDGTPDRCRHMSRPVS